MYSVLLDDNGYFTGTYVEVGHIDGSIEVDELPSDLTNHKSTCWKYEEYEETIVYEDKEEVVLKHRWVFDDEKYQQVIEYINQEKENQPKSNKKLTEENKQLSANIDDLVGIVVDLQFQLDINSITEGEDV